MSVVRKYLERKYTRTPDVVSEMADADSSELTFCEVGSSENGDQLGSPKVIPAENMVLEDIRVDIATTSKTNNEVKPNDSDKDLSGSSINALIQDFYTEEPVTQAFIGAESNVLYQAKPSLMKPVARAMVPFEKGYSQLDWLKLISTHRDLSGLEAQSKRRSISLKEVKQHRSGESIWIILKGGVYNIAPYMKFHPGGVDMLMEVAGMDCTDLFNHYHGWVNAEFLLKNCYIGSFAPYEQGQNQRWEGQGLRTLYRLPHDGAPIDPFLHFCGSPICLSVSSEPASHSYNKSANSTFTQLFKSVFLSQQIRRRKKNREERERKKEERIRRSKHLR